MDFDPSTAVPVFDEQEPDDLRGYFDAPDLPEILPAPLRPHATDFLEAAQEYNLNPRVLAAISMLETDSGKSKAFRLGQNAMGISDARGPVVQPSVRDSIFKMARTLSNPRGPYAKAKTLDEFGAIYAPPGAGNDVHGTNAGWASGVRSHLAKLGGFGRPQGDTEEIDTALFDPSTATPVVAAEAGEPGGFDPSTASTIVPEQVAQEAAKATYGAVQAFNVMAAPGRLDWSDVMARNRSDRQARGVLASETLRKKGLNPELALNPTFAPLLEKSDDPELIAAVRDFREYDVIRQEAKNAEAALIQEQQNQMDMKELAFNQWARGEGATAPPEAKFAKWMETAGHAMTDLAQFEKWQELHGTKPNALEAGMSQFAGSIFQQAGAAARTLAPSGQAFSDAANYLSESGQMEKGIAETAGAGTAAQIGRGAGSFAGMMLGTPAGKAGLALGALRGAAEASEATLAQGGSSADAKSAALQTLPALAAYMFGGHLAGKLAGRMMGAEAGVAARTAASTGANLTSNIAAGSILRAMEGQDWVPTAETLTMDTLFAIHGGHGVFKDASAVAKERAGQALQEADAAMSRISKAAREAGAQNRPAVVEAAPVAAAEPPPQAAPARTSISEVITPAPDRTSIDEVIKRNQPAPEPPAPPAEAAPEPPPARAVIEAEAQKVGPIRYDGDTQMGDDGFYYFSDTTSKPGTTISFTVESKGPPSAEAIAAKHAERLAAFGVELPKAPADEAPAQPEAPAFKWKFPSDDFGSDSTPVAFAVMDMGGVLSKTAAKKAKRYAGNEDLWSGQFTAEHPTHNKVFKVNGQAPDKVAQALYEANLIPEPTPEAMWTALQKESTSSRNAKLERGRQEMAELATRKQAADFDKTAADPKSGSAVSVSDLAVGDTVTVGSETLKVTEVSPEGDVILEDGKRFGVQEVKDGEVLYGQHEKAEQTPPEDDPFKVDDEPAPPPGPKATTEGPIGIRNAVTGALRKELGLPERVTPELRDFDTLHTEATEALKADPEAGNRLVSQLENAPGMMLSDTQDAIATFELNRRRMARNEASRRVNEAKTPEEREAAMEDFTRLDDATIKMIGLLERTGTESARGLNARRLMLSADYSLSRMLENTRTIRNGGEKLSPEQVAEVTELHAKIADLEKRIAEKETGEAASAAKRTFDQVLRQTQKEAKSAAKSKKSIVDFLSEKEAEAKKRIVERRGKLFSTIDPLNIAGLVDEAIIGAAHIARGVRDFGAWSKRMLADFGERIKPALKGLWDKSNELHTGYETEFKAANKAKTPKDILEKLDPSKGGPTQKQVFDLARAHINAGVEGFEPVMEATRKDLETVYPGITTRQVHDAYSQYGKTTIPSKDADLVKLREYRALSRLQSQLEDAINKIPPLKTGPQRDKATARVRELQKQVKDAMRKAGIEPRSEEDQLTSSLGAAKTRMRNEIEEMTKAIETKTPRTENKSKLEYDAEAKALKEKLDAKRAEYEAIFGKNEKTTEERQAEAIKNLDKSIAEEDAMLQEGKLKRDKKGKPLPETPEMIRKKAELEAMRKLRRELAKEEKPAKDEATIARERLAADKKRIRTASEKLKERIKKGDYEPRKRREPEMDPEKVNLLYELQQTQRKFNEGLIESKRAKRGVGRKIFDAGTETLNLVRQVLTSGDLPPLLRQGLFTLANPTVSGPAVVRSLNSMFSGKRRFKEDLKIKNNPDHRLAEISGLNLPNAETTSLVKQEEEHAGRFFRELPRWTVLGPLLRMSERGYNTFISSIRMDLFSKMLKAYSVDKTDLATTKRVADIINTITGRASLPGKKLEQAAPALNMALFATRYTMSRFKVALGEPLWTGNAKTRTFALEQYGRLLAGAAAIYAIAHKFGAKVETDPRSANFGKINIGDDAYIDPMAGLTQVSTLMARLVTGETKTSKSGELVPLRETMRPLQTVAPDLAAKGKPNMLIGDTTDILKQFARTKLAPVPGEIVNLLAGEDLSGKPARFGGKVGGAEVPGAGTLSRVGAPISFQDILKVMERQGVPKGAAVWILSLWGAGLQQRDKQEKTGGMRLSL